VPLDGKLAYPMHLSAARIDSDPMQWWQSLLGLRLREPCWDSPRAKHKGNLPVKSPLRVTCIENEQLLESRRGRQEQASRFEIELGVCQSGPLAESQLCIHPANLAGLSMGERFSLTEKGAGLDSLFRCTSDAWPTRLG
jgi:hypothetical protein